MKPTLDQRFQLRKLFNAFTNAHYAMAADEWREGSSDAAVKRRFMASNEAEKAFLKELNNLLESPGDCTL